MKSIREPIHQIGTKFTKRGRKDKRVYTVVDVIMWINSKREVVGIRYHAQCEFMGQTITDRDVLETTISRGLVN